jgi:hypothetical protein
MKKKKIVYIIGAGRSGTTLLDIVLGNNSNTISLGEINRFFKRNGLPPKRDRGSLEFEFWEKINNELKQHLNGVSYNYYDRLFKKNEYHTSILKSITNKNNKEYINTIKAQYQVIFENIEEDILIESSKYPVRALNLSKYLPQNNFDVMYIYLKKNPVSVVSSFQKKDIEQPRKSFFAANLYYLLVNLLCIFVTKKLKNKGHRLVTITYEDFINDTELTIEKMSNSLNIDFSSLLNHLSNNEQLKTGFLFDGNRIRLKETLTLQVLNNKQSKTINYYFTRAFNYIVYRK